MEKKWTLGLGSVFLFALVVLFVLWQSRLAAVHTRVWLDVHVAVYKQLQSTYDDFRLLENDYAEYMAKGAVPQYSAFTDAVSKISADLLRLQKIGEADKTYGESLHQLENIILTTAEEFKGNAAKKQAEVQARAKAQAQIKTQEQTKAGTEDALGVKAIDKAESKVIEKVVVDNAKEHQLTEEVLSQISQLELSEVERFARKVLSNSWFVAGEWAVRIVLLTLLLITVPVLFVMWRTSQNALESMETEFRNTTSALERARRQLDHAASIDPLTRLLNLHGLENALKEEVNGSVDRPEDEEMVAILIDCDNFLQINERMGFAQGDMVLQEVAQRIKQSVRPTDHICRVGGDEFLVFLPSTKVSSIMRIAERIRNLVSDTPIEIASESIKQKVSLGVAKISPSNASVDQLLAKTRSAMRFSKANGKNSIYLSHETAKQLGANLGSEAEGDTVGLLLDVQNFHTVLQPIFALSDETLCGYEIFTRGPKGALQGPMEFFQACKNHDILTTVDLQCLKLCIAAISPSKQNMRFHVNLFPSTLVETPVDKLIAMFPSNRDGRKFCVELSEEQFIGEPGYLKDAVNAIKEAGILFAIDDVGFGQTSLEGLILLEPDIVKVDRQYVVGIARDPAKARLLKRLANVAKSLGAEIVAEGIEDREDLPVLCDLGVHYGQGFLWGNLLESVSQSDPSSTALA